MATDGEMTFDHVITDWEVIFTGAKHSWLQPTTVKLFFFFYQYSFPQNLGYSSLHNKCIRVQGGDLVD